MINFIHDMKPQSIGLVTGIGIDYERAFDMASDLSFDHLEILMNGHATRDQLEERSAWIEQAASASGLSLMVHLPFPINLGSPFPPIRDACVAELKRCVDTAVDFGAEKGVIHPDSHFWTLGWDDSEIQDTVIDSLNELKVYAQSSGFEICPENHYPGQFPISNYEKLLQRTNLAMTVDTGHARVSGWHADDIAAFISETPEWVSHIHLNDTRRAQDEHLPFGAGNIEFDLIFEAIDEVDWTGSLSLEVYTDSEEYITISKERLDEMFPA